MSFTIAIKKLENFSTIRLENSLEKTIVEIYTFGALLNEFSITANNQSINCIDAFSSVDDAKSNITKGFNSAKLSPFVCRMKSGTYNFNNTNYTVEKYYLQPHAIHGLIYDAVYNIVSTTENESFASVTLGYEYAANDIGYPFNFYIEVIYTLSSNHQLNITTHIINKNSYEIPYADGWHPYFTLGTSIDKCSLQFDSNTLMEFDETLIPTTNTIRDNRFIKPTSLINIYLDNCYQLSQKGECTLYNDFLKLTIKPEATYPYLQIYTPPHRNSIAIENLSALPDCFNNKIGLQLLKPQKKYSFSTNYILQSTKKL